MSKKKNYAIHKAEHANSQGVQRTPDSHIRYIQTFSPLPWQRRVLDDLSPTLLLTGSAGGGKSHVYAEKIHAACLKYPNSEWIIARKIKEDVMDSAYRLLRQKVVGKDERVKFHSDSAEYFNNSWIYFIGMRGERERKAVRSIGTGAICGAWMEEAHEFEEEDYEEIDARVRGTQMGWTQVGLSTNPNVPLHWIRRRLIIGGEATVFLSSEKDNPYNDTKYTKRLADMKGVEGLRLRDGLWVESTGLVIPTFYDDYDDEIRNTPPVGCVVDEADYNPNGMPMEIWADQGYAGEWDQKAKMFTTRSHPRVLLLVQETARGGFNIFAESYAVQQQEDEHLSDLQKMCIANDWPWPPRKGVYDSASPSLGSYLKKSGVRTTVAGTKNVDDSIIVLRNNIDRDENGWRSIQIHPRCRLLRLELGSWTYGRNGRPGEYLDNGPDCLRYGIYHHNGPNKTERDVGVGHESEELDHLMDQIDIEYEKFVRKVGVAL